MKTTFKEQIFVFSNTSSRSRLKEPHHFCGAGAGSRALRRCSSGSGSNGSGSNGSSSNDSSFKGSGSKLDVQHRLIKKMSQTVKVSYFSIHFLNK
jgi:hypothetical protein